MTTLTAIFLAINGIIFALWAGMMFWTLFRLRRRAASRAVAENAASPVSAFGLFFFSPDFRADRWRIGLSTAVMLMINLLIGTLMRP